MTLKIKVCGMKQPANIEQIAPLAPEYVGFIFASSSPRYVGKHFDPAHLNLLSPESRTVGVFVDEFIPRILDKVDYYHLDAVQLHGSESVEYVHKIRSLLPDLEVIKAIAIPSSCTPEEFHALIAPYEACVSTLLLDTKSGEASGGTGMQFNWSLIETYPWQCDLLIAGGIDASGVSKLVELASRVPAIKGIDLNSRCELAPGVKDPKVIAQCMRLAREASATATNTAQICCNM
jgi:phosphoribosylanthranilate isomerase